MNRRLLDAVTPLSAAACALVACTASWVPLRAVATTPLCLILPGYALTRAMFARSTAAGKRTQTMRMTLTVALSLTTLIIGSLVLDLAPGGIHRDSWAVLLTGVTAVASITSARRRSEDRNDALVFKLPRASWGTTVMLVLAVVIGMGALVASRIPWAARNAIGYTQLWILPAANGEQAVHIGVVCDQLHATDYRLVVNDGRHNHTWRIGLRPGQSRHLTVMVRADSTGYVTATLFRAGRTAEYRQVRLALSKL